MLPAYVKRKPTYWKYIPWLSGPANTIYPYIYMPKKVFEDLIDQHPSPNSLATLAHEETHLKRQEQIGIGKYALLYICSHRFRFTEELAATQAQIQLLHTHGVQFDTHARAKALSSWEYLWCAPFTKALQQLNEINKH